MLKKLKGIQSYNTQISLYLLNLQQQCQLHDIDTSRKWFSRYYDNFFGTNEAFSRFLPFFFDYKICRIYLNTFLMKDVWKIAQNIPKNKFTHLSSLVLVWSLMSVVDVTLLLVLGTFIVYFLWCALLSVSEINYSEKILWWLMLKIQ